MAREYYAELKINETDNGELLEKQYCFLVDEDEEYDNADDVGENLGEDIQEYLENLLEFDYSTANNVVMRLRIIELDEDLPDDNDD